MLKQLSVENYALISRLNIDFYTGFSTITGETGAGKSILLGALSLLLGNRADSTAIANRNKNCVVEGIFDIQAYKLQRFFNANDLEYEQETVIRRMISPSGKSRAFINDIPVTLNTLKELGAKLIDVHSQHKNAEIGKSGFQLQAIDSFGKLEGTLEKYQKAFKNYATTQKQLKELLKTSAKHKADIDYIRFRYDKLESANLNPNEQQALEEEQDTLNHAEEIKQNLSKIHFLLSEEEQNVLDMLSEAKQAAFRIRSYFTEANDISERLESVHIELTDIAAEAEIHAGKADFNPNRADEISLRLNLIYELQQQFGVPTIVELLEIQSGLEKQIVDTDSSDEKIKQLETQLKEREHNLTELSVKLSEKRKAVLPKVERKITESLKNLGMPNAVFQIALTPIDFTSVGSDEIQFLFTANKAQAPQPIGNVISGGEMSRVMLSIKAIIASSVALPTIIFDEIDTGVSGDIADKIGNTMQQMGAKMQVLSITHLPQVASKGEHHYKVYKNNGSTVSETQIKALTNNDRVTEIAKMLSGETLTDAAIENAKVLLAAK